MPLFTSSQTEEFLELFLSRLIVQFVQTMYTTQKIEIILQHELQKVKTLVETKKFKQKQNTSVSYFQCRNLAINELQHLFFSSLNFSGFELHNYIFSIGMCCIFPEKIHSQTTESPSTPYTRPTSQNQNLQNNLMLSNPV